MEKDRASLLERITTLANQYNNTISCFDSIQLSLTSDVQDFSTSLLKLECARLQLSRWATSLNLDSNIQDINMSSLKQLFQSSSTVDLARQILENITEIFSDAEEYSKKYKKRADSNDVDSGIFDPQKNFDSSAAHLHRGIRRLTLNRQQQTSITKTPKWTVYQEKQLRRLIEDIIELVDKLIDLFPASLQSQRQLCEDEVSALGDQESISVLKKIAAGQDKLLEEALKKSESTVQESYHIVFGANNGGLQIAHNSGTMSGFTFGKGNSGGMA